MVRVKMMKRVKKEVALLIDNYGENNIIFTPTIPINETVPLVIYIKKNPTLVFNLKITLHSDYPFKSPEVSLYNKEIDICYYDFFKICSKFYYFSKQTILTEHICPCCFNIMCRRELNQSLFVLTQDVQKFGDQFHRLRERYFASKYISFVNNLNDDILKYILDYI